MTDSIFRIVSHESVFAFSCANHLIDFRLKAIYLCLLYRKKLFKNH